MLGGGEWTKAELRGRVQGPHSRALGRWSFTAELSTREKARVDNPTEVVPIDPVPNSQRE
jgi:hypothetical protein